MAPYELLFQGGHLIDPANQIDSPMDVAISGGKIAQVAQHIPAQQAQKTVSVAGRYITPGLLDIHMHAYGYEGWLFPDEQAFPNGVTTVVDAGGAGWKNFADFRNTIMARSKSRVLAFLNIVGAGMLGTVEQDVTEMDPIPCAETLQAHPDVLVGVKTAHFGGGGWEAVDSAIRAGELSNTPAMFDFAPKPTRTYRDFLLNKLRPGDIHTHLYAQHIPLLDQSGKVQDYLWQARERGVWFDTGHGAGSFWFRIAVPALQQGFPPDSISTDLHKSSALIPNARIMPTLSKFLNMGMGLQEAIFRTTVMPARMIRRPELGTLSVGAEADVAILELSEGDFGFVDSGHARLRGKYRADCALTLRSGTVVWDRDGLTWPDWETAGNYRRID